MTAKLEDSREIGRRLRALREARGIRRERLALDLNMSLEQELRGKWLLLGERHTAGARPSGIDRRRELNRSPPQQPHSVRDGKQISLGY